MLCGARQRKKPKIFVGLCTNQVESGKSYKINNWILEKEHMCYVFNDNMFLSKEDAIDDGYTILEWEDFMEKEFTLSDLKVGMLVENRGGDRYIIAQNEGYMFGANETGWMDFDNFKDDMTYTYEPEPYFDIIKVYGIPRLNTNFFNYNIKNRKLLFERKEPKELTMQEIADKFGIPVDQLKIKK